MFIKYTSQGKDQVLSFPSGSYLVPVEGGYEVRQSEVVDFVSYSSRSLDELAAEAPEWLKKAMDALDGLEKSELEDPAPEPQAEAPDATATRSFNEQWSAKQTVDDLYNMPLDELRKKAEQYLSTPVSRLELEGLSTRIAKLEATTDYRLRKLERELADQIYSRSCHQQAEVFNTLLDKFKESK
jgi:hypothetical protein